MHMIDPPLNIEKQYIEHNSRNKFNAVLLIGHDMQISTSTVMKEGFMLHRTQSQDSLISSHPQAIRFEEIRNAKKVGRSRNTRTKQSTFWPTTRTDKTRQISTRVFTFGS